MGLWAHFNPLCILQVTKNVQCDGNESSPVMCDTENSKFYLVALSNERLSQ